MAGSASLSSSSIERQCSGELKHTGYSPALLPAFSLQRKQQVVFKTLVGNWRSLSAPWAILSVSRGLRMLAHFILMVTYGVGLIPVIVILVL